MLKDLRSSAVAIVVLTVLLGGLYPLVVTGIAQPLFGDKADGDPRLIATPNVLETGETDEDGEPVTRPDPRFFQPRPSQTGYSSTATAFSNLGPNSQDTVDAFTANIEAYAALEGVPASEVPNDAAQMSASGIDPDISPENARIQARRVARERGLDVEQVLDIVDDVEDGRLLGVIGEPTVNVSDLNDEIEEVSR